MGNQLPKKGHSSPRPLFGPCLLWSNGRPSQLLLSTCLLLFERFYIYEPCTGGLPKAFPLGLLRMATVFRSFFCDVAAKCPLMSEKCTLPEDEILVYSLRIVQCGTGPRHFWCNLYPPDIILNGAMETNGKQHYDK